MPGAVYTVYKTLFKTKAPFINENMHVSNNITVTALILPLMAYIGMDVMQYIQ